MMKRAVGCLMVIVSASFFLSAPLYAQVAKMTPEQPKWGDTIQVTYDPKAEGAAFFPGDEVYAVLHISLEEGSAQKWIELRKTSDVFVGEIPVEKGMAYLNIYFITREKWDQKTSLSAAVHREEGVLAQGANQQMMISSSPDIYLDYFRKERELYPDNLAVFRDKWFFQGAVDKANLLSTVEEDMAVLKKRLSEPTVDLLYSLSYGHMLLGQEPEARDMIRTLVEKYPQSFYTRFAIASYEYQVLSQGIKGEGPEQVKTIKKRLLTENPRSSFARKQILFFVGDEEVSFDVIRSVCDPWMREEQDNPMPYYILAIGYDEKTAEYERALQLLDKAIALLLHGKLRFYNDISGMRTQFYLAQWHGKKADIHLRSGDPAKALADIKTAQALEKEARPQHFEAEGKIWQELGLYGKAENAWLEALRLGSKEAEKHLEEIYREKNESVEGFATYLSRAVEKQKPAGSEENVAAPAFAVESLEGEPLELSALKGKVVVLNFWFVNCAPCRVEMPGLNTLTEEFKDEDVVFIAFALDKADALEVFLKEKEFKYSIVPESGKIASDYGVKVYPTHVIINKSGQVEFTLTGGSEDRHEQLRPLIKNLLQ